MDEKQVKDISLWILSSQKRVFDGDRPTEDIRYFTALKNEPISFVIAYRSNVPDTVNGKVFDMPISVRITSDTLPISTYKVGYLPFSASECEDASDCDAGVCPDVLYKRESCPNIIKVEGDRRLPYYEENENRLIIASPHRTRSLYVTVNEEGKCLMSGEHRVEIEAISLMSGETMEKKTVTVKLIDALLPENDLIYTNWMHYDCLADITGIPVWTDEYFEILKGTVRNAAIHGMTTLLTPAFTPALDTPIGTERANVQLVGVKKTAEGYEFDFALLRRFIEMARECGIKRFEHCHLFSQWGVRTAINVYGEENGKTVRLFGWDTPATDPEYVSFITLYLNKFLELAKEMGIENDLFFHISDEPNESHLENYTHALNTIKSVIGDKPIGDALSDYAFFKKGLVKLPVVRINHANDFDGRCDSMMLYYTGGEKGGDFTNRLLTNAPWRTRALGLHMFRYNAKGFLQWGYNYYYGRMSKCLVDPLTDPCLYKDMPADCYLVYMSRDNKTMPSLREKSMCEAVNDYRALRVLESLIGRDAALRVCRDVLGEDVDIQTIPKSGEAMLALRERINSEIEKNLKAN